MNSPTTRVPLPNPRMPVPTGAGMTHRGLVREINEDSILTDPSGALWAVADGMGGHGNGDIASDIVTEHLVSTAEGIAPVAALRQQLERANSAICAHASTVNSGTMGATAVAMVVERATAHIVWVGDSRAYLLRGGRLRLLTIDHTVVQDLVQSGVIDPAQAEHHPEAHIVTRAVGGAPELDADSMSVPLVQGDRLLMCSDGLTACVSDQEIRDLLALGHDPEAICNAMVSTTLQNGAPDNVSVICVFMKEP